MNNIGADIQYLLDGETALIFRCDYTGKISNVWASHHFSEHLPKQGRLRGLHLRNIFPSDFIKAIEKSCEQARLSVHKPILQKYQSDSGETMEFEIHSRLQGQNEYQITLRERTEHQALERNRQWLTFLQEVSTEPWALIDWHSTHIAVNEAYCKIFGRPRNEVLGETVTKIWGEKVYKIFLEDKLERSLVGQETKFEDWVQFSRKDRRYLVGNIRPFPNTSLPNYSILVFRDNSEIKKLQDTIYNYRKRLSILSEINSIFLSTQSPTEVAQEALKQCRTLIPYSQAGVLMINPETNESLIVAKDFTTGSLHASQEPPLINQRDGLPEEKEYRVLEKLILESGVQSYFSIPLLVEQKLIGALILGSMTQNAFNSEHVELARQIGEQLAIVFYNALLFDQVRSNQERLRHLTTRLVSVQEDERKRISLELHDQAGQALTALKLQLAFIKSEMPPELLTLRKQYEAVDHLLDDTTDQIRFIARELRPPALEKVGINQTIEDFCAQISRQTGIKIKYNGLELPGLPTHTQINLYRVVQEAMTNILRHAEADLVEIDLSYNKDNVRLKIRDNGVGFDGKRHLSAGNNSGIGILGMEERMLSLGGKIEIQSYPRKGTTLLAVAPWSEEK